MRAHAAPLAPPAARRIVAAGMSIAPRQPIGASNSRSPACAVSHQINRIGFELPKFGVLFSGCSVGSAGSRGEAAFSHFASSAASVFSPKVPEPHLDRRASINLRQPITARLRSSSLLPPGTILGLPVSWHWWRAEARFGSGSLRDIGPGERGVQTPGPHPEGMVGPRGSQPHTMPAPARPHRALRGGSALAAGCLRLADRRGREVASVA